MHIEKEEQTSLQEHQQTPQRHSFPEREAEQLQALQDPELADELAEGQNQDPGFTSGCPIAPR